MKFGKSILGNYSEGTNREFLITNGLGSFAGGAINGNYSRRYHGLLISSFLPPLDRYLVFHKIEEEVDGVDISTRKTIENEKSVIKKGYIYQDSFEVNPFPKFRYSLNGSIIEKELFMVYEKEIIVIKYKLLKSIKEKVKLNLNLFFNYRDFHEMNKLPNNTVFVIEKEDKRLKVAAGEENKPIYIYSNKLIDFKEKREVIENIRYDIELEERGDKKLDNSFKVGTIETEIGEGEEIYIVGSMTELDSLNVSELYHREIERVNKLKDNLSETDLFLRDLALAADNFIVYREGTKGKTILAGYPWFGDWGRDTMIALPGLTLCTKRYDDARSILETFSKYCNEGMLPNKFPDREGETLYYNTIDASLWFFYAVDKYIEYTGDYDFIREKIYPSLKEIIEYHIKGTRYKIKVDETDGLVYGGDLSTQLTWMDARYEGWAVTPRYGKAVEINALWYNALMVIKKLAEKYNEDAELYTKYIQKISETFENTFWNEKTGCLYDYIVDEKKIADIRPNQVFAVSLPYSLISKEKAKSVVDVVFEKLYTPHGLKSLSEDNEKYLGIYRGTLFERDAAYHQGTVWSWPIGHFITAYNKIYNKKEEVEMLLEGLKLHFYQEGCINSISEIFDGDYPVAARGCYAQAWSIAEVIRVLKDK